MTSQRSLDETIEQLGLDRYLHGKMTERFIMGNRELEQPIFFAIMSAGGIVRYSKKFQPKDFNEQLLGGLVSALSSVADEIFSMEEPQMDAIQIGDYHITIRRVVDFQLCYIYVGALDMGNMRMDRIVTQLESKGLKGQIDAQLRKSKWLPARLLKDLIAEIFGD